MDNRTKVAYWLEGFTLTKHGDSRERQWWPLVAKDFPAYEAFWRLYVVPLTNRVDTSIAASDPRWIRVRPPVSDQYLRFAMAHYSVFYWIARASEIIARHPKIEYPEDVIYLLQAAGEDLVRFLGELIHIGKDAGAEFPFPAPEQYPKGYAPVFAEIKAYRDVLL